MRNHYSVPLTAEGVVVKRRFVKYGANDGGAVQAAAATDLIIGVSDSLGADAAGARCETYLEGCVEIELGGAVTRGQQLTSDAVGRAIAAAPAAGSNVRCGGFAMSSGVLGDVIEIFLTPSTLQG